MTTAVITISFYKKKTSKGILLQKHHTIIIFLKKTGTLLFQKKTSSVLLQKHYSIKKNNILFNKCSLTKTLT